MKFQTTAIVDAEDVSSEIISEVIDLRNNYGFAIQATFTGSPTGSVLVEGSNDRSNWSQIEALTISGTDTLSTNKDAIYWPYIRVKKDAGGTGTMTVTITIKGA